MKPVFNRGKIMKKIIMILSIYLSFNFHASAQVYPVDIIVPPIPGYETIEGVEIPVIYHLRSESNSLEIHFMTFYVYADAYYIGTEFTIDWSAQTQYDLADKSFSDFKKLETDWHVNTPLIHDASSVILNGETMLLENSYFYKEEDTGHPYPLVTEKTIFSVCISPNRLFIGGSCRISYHGYHVSGLDNYLQLWSSQDGKELFSQFLGRGYSEFYFSPQSTFLAGRYCDDIDNGPEQNPRWIRGPRSILVNTTTHDKIASNRDVAFTSGDEYFVTERDGVPTLVHVRTDTNILRYAMESPMISAAFSPDNQRLYIAGANSQIYVFDSHLPSQTPGWEVYP